MSASNQVFLKNRKSTRQYFTTLLPATTHYTIQRSK